MRIVGDTLDDLNVEKKPQRETWYFNEVVKDSFFEESYYCNFISNDETFVGIVNSHSVHLFTLGYYRNKTERPIQIFNDAKGGAYWTNESYRTITLEEPAAGDLLTFLEANATKIS